MVSDGLQDVSGWARPRLGKLRRVGGTMGGDVMREKLACNRPCTGGSVGEKLVCGASAGYVSSEERWQVQSKEEMKGVGFLYDSQRAVA